MSPALAPGNSKTALNFCHLASTARNKEGFCPSWCGSVDGVLACEPKGRWFDFHSGHMPGLQARSPVWYV